MPSLRSSPVSTELNSAAATAAAAVDPSAPLAPDDAGIAVMLTDDVPKLRGIFALGADDDDDAAAAVAAAAAAAALFRIMAAISSGMSLVASPSEEHRPLALRESPSKPAAARNAAVAAAAADDDDVAVADEPNGLALDVFELLVSVL